MTTLYIQAFPLYFYNQITNIWYSYINFVATDFNTQPMLQSLVQYGATENTSASPYPVFVTGDLAGAIAYTGAIQGPALVSQINTAYGVTVFSTYDIEQVPSPVAAALLSLSPIAHTGAYSDLIGAPSLASVASSGAYSDLTGKPSLSSVATSGAYNDLTGKPSLATVATSGSYNDLSDKPSVPTRVFGFPSRSLNSAFQVSTTQDAIVNYSVDVASTISLTSGQTGTVVLEYADDSGISTNVKTVMSGVNGNTGSLTIGLNLTDTNTITVSGVVPQSKYVRIRTVNTTGTPTFTFRSAQEVLI